jgi:hypothetical protein
MDQDIMVDVQIPDSKVIKPRQNSRMQSLDSAIESDFSH